MPDTPDPPPRSRSNWAVAIEAGDQQTLALIIDLVLEHVALYGKKPTAIELCARLNQPGS